jgi:hypothetical protein
VSELQARLQAALGDVCRIERELTRGQVVIKLVPPDLRVFAQ